MPVRPTLVWFRQDLRLADNPALAAACDGPVVPVYIWSPADEGDWPPGAASRWWLHHALSALDQGLRKKGSRLLIRKGAPLQVLLALVRETGAQRVLWNRRYEPAAVARDAKIKAALKDARVPAASFNASLLFEPWTLTKADKTAYQVFTPYWRACLAQGEPPAPLPAPSKIAAPSAWPDGLTLEALRLLPNIDWAGGMREAWVPGEAGAAAQLKKSLDTVSRYAAARDALAEAGTSRLSPHLHFGEIGPRQIWHAARRRALGDRTAGAQKSTEAYLRQLVWREFAHHLLFHFPHTPVAPLRRDFASFRWAKDKAALAAWQRGRTGYPVVDAGLRELWATGWMHNRARLIAASFLVKDLLHDWREGARWFWDTLVDADLANNTLGWQWTAGCGADAAPYFRIFNPVLQGEKFDPKGDYVRRWVPALAALPAKWIHRPWEAPPEVLSSADIVLGKTYPAPIVDHGEARQRALAAFDRL